VRTTLLSLSWVALCSSIGGLLFGIELDLNIWNWVGTWHFQSLACMTGIIALLIGAFFLARTAEHTIIITVAAASCIAIIVAAIYFLAPEPMGNSGVWFSRRVASPDWYRWGRLAIASLPLCILILALIGRRSQR
jgi:hypothetical protein